MQGKINWKHYPTQIYTNKKCVVEYLLNTWRSSIDFVGHPWQLSLHQTETLTCCVGLHQKGVLELWLGFQLIAQLKLVISLNFWSNSKPNALGDVNRLYLEIVHYWNQLQQIATVWTASNEATGGIFQVTSGSWERRTMTECTGRYALKGERWEAAGQAVKMAMVGISIERYCSVRAEINVERRGQSSYKW